MWILLLSITIICMPPQNSHQRFENFKYQNSWDPKNGYCCFRQAAKK
jgi:hypothetical protein